MWKFDLVVGGALSTTGCSGGVMGRCLRVSPPLQRLLGRAPVLLTGTRSTGMGQGGVGPDPPRADSPRAALVPQDSLRGVAGAGECLPS